MAVKHLNSGHCPMCMMIMDRFGGVYQPLRKWFESFQQKYPEAHISCAGRGHVDQEEAFHRGASRAHYGESAHNYNCALDLWVNDGGKYTLPELWFHTKLKPELPDWIEWGATWTNFPELPHVQVRMWKDLRQQGVVSLVEKLAA